MTGRISSERLSTALLGLLAAISLSPPWATAEDSLSFVLVREGQPVASVVHSGDHPALRAAVEDLALYAERITGAKLRVVQGTEDEAGPTLHIGKTSLFEHLSDAVEAIELDGFAMARVGEDLVVAGKVPQGTSNAVTTILQDHFGVRWYSKGPLWETVPRQASLEIRVEPNRGGRTYVENPSFLERSLWGGLPSQDYGRRHRLTLKGIPLPYTGTGHHLSRVVNPRKHGDHSEYFAYWGGKRHVAHDVHPCFTHPDMPRIFTEYVRGGGTSLGVNDNLSACRCERCLEVDGASASYHGMVNLSESYFQLISTVARDVAMTHPDRRIGVFAYQLTNAPPKSVEHIGDNVDVVLCQDTSQNFDPEYRRIDQQMSADWVEKCGHVRFYDYVGISHWTPRYFPGVLADQIKHLARVGVVGYGTHASSMLDSSMPMYYVLYRLLWNAELDPDQLIREMITDLYGEASEPIREFYAHWEQCWMRQQKGRWFFGMDDFRGEMSIYHWEDFEKGRRLLEKASKKARDEKVRERVAFLRDRFSFTHASARAFTVSMAAIRWEPAGGHESAVRLSNEVTDVWRFWEPRFEKTVHLDGTPMAGWVDKTARVRVWSLKQQIRDAVLAPGVRWICANEGRMPPHELRRVERLLAGVAMLNRSMVESRVTERVEAIPYPPRVDALLVADVPKVREAPALAAKQSPWKGSMPVDAAPWFFLDRTVKKQIGKYEDPVARHHQVMARAPARDDLSVECQAAWDEQNLYLRVDVRDERHVQAQSASAMWKEDSIRVALAPRRDDFLYDVHSWTYIWGGYRGRELELGVSLRGEDTIVHLEAIPDSVPESLDHRSSVRALARRHPQHTVYELAIDWRLIPDFEPAPEKSLGFWLAVHDTDRGELVTAEYGSAVNRVKRPTGFSAIRLAR